MLQHLSYGLKKSFKQKNKTFLTTKIIVEIEKSPKVTPMKK